jgi:transcriptional regulator with XRE-family HTH domain
MALRRKHLTLRRRAIGLSQEQLAERLEVDRTTIGRWESGDSSPQPWLRPRLASALGLSLDELDHALGADAGDPSHPRSDSATGQPAAGEVVDRDCSIDIDIDPDGWATLRYRYELLNKGRQPFVRLVRDVWFEHTAGQLLIEPLADGDRNVAIQRIHEAPNLAKFACLLSPPVAPGEVASIGYTCVGGRFLDHLYWRHSTQHATHQLSLKVRHRGAGRLLHYGAVEECSDGSEIFATDSVEWSVDHGDVLVALTRRMLQPGQSVTLRWAVQHPAERNRDSDAT